MLKLLLLAFAHLRIMPVWRRILSRRVQFYFLSRYSNRHVKEIEELTFYIGDVVSERTTLMTAIGWATYGRPGFETKDGVRVNDICWEAPVGITIYLAGKAAFGIGVDLYENRVDIRQLQGVRGIPLDDDLRRWPRWLVEGCCNYARAHGVRYVRLYRAHNSLFFNYPDIDWKPENRAKVIEAHQRRMRSRYDGTARKMKFKMHKNYGEWENPNYTRAK